MDVDLFLKVPCILRLAVFCLLNFNDIFSVTFMVASSSEVGRLRWCTLLTAVTNPFSRRGFNIIKGLVNDHFLSLVNTREPEYVVQTIEKYFADVEMILSEVSCDVDKSKADFCKLALLVHEIEHKSASIGAEHTRQACPVLIKACTEKNKRSFSMSLMWLKHEFCSTRDKLTSIVQMERRIIRLGRQN